MKPHKYSILCFHVLLCILVSFVSDTHELSCYHCDWTERPPGDTVCRDTPGSNKQFSKKCGEKAYSCLKLSTTSLQTGKIMIRRCSALHPPRNLNAVICRNVGDVTYSYPGSSPNPTPPLVLENTQICTCKKDFCNKDPSWEVHPQSGVMSGGSRALAIPPLKYQCLVLVFSWSLFILFYGRR